MKKIISKLYNNITKKDPIKVGDIVVYINTDEFIEVVDIPDKKDYENVPVCRVKVPKNTEMYKNYQWSVMFEYHDAIANGDYHKASDILHRNYILVDVPIGYLKRIPDQEIIKLLY